jgi:hypothetical protein
MTLNSRQFAELYNWAVWASDGTPFRMEFERNPLGLAVLKLYSACGESRFLASKLIYEVY